VGGGRGAGGGGRGAGAGRRARSHGALLVPLPERGVGWCRQERGAREQGQGAAAAQPPRQRCSRQAPQPRGCSRLQRPHPDPCNPQEPAAGALPDVTAASQVEIVCGNLKYEWSQVGPRASPRPPPASPPAPRKTSCPLPEAAQAAAPAAACGPRPGARRCRAPRRPVAQRWRCRAPRRCSRPWQTPAGAASWTTRWRCSRRRAAARRTSGARSRTTRRWGGGVGVQGAWPRGSRRALAAAPRLAPLCAPSPSIGLKLQASPLPPAPPPLPGRPA
jgi:hypothetical protein